MSQIAGEFRSDIVGESKACRCCPIHVVDVALWGRGRLPELMRYVQDGCDGGRASQVADDIDGVA